MYAICGVDITAGFIVPGGSHAEWGIVAGWFCGRCITELNRSDPDAFRIEIRKPRT
jgi:hypothetical protein